MKTPFARIAAGLTTLALATAGLNVAVTIAEPVVAQASTVNGPITRSEVLARAQAWVDAGYTYDTNASAPGPGDGRAYRKDCSGLVAMAWHLSTSYDTTDFKAKAQSNDGMHVIGLNDLQPGDAVVRDPDGHGGEGHMELFAYWKNQSDHSQGAYVYSFNKTGETVRNPYQDSNFSNRGFDSWSELTTYVPIRYDNIADDSVSGVEDPLVSQQGGDFNGDGRDDGVILYHHTDSSISVHTAIANTSGGFGPYTVGYTVPANSWDWNAFRTIAGDFNGDGRSDLAIMYHHTDSSVSMHTALADTSGHLGPFTVSYTVPAGSWDFNALRLLSGDFNGDGRDDAVILYHHTDSSISVHTAIANTSGGFGPFTVGYTVPANSWDWNAFRTIAGDFNGDGRSDLAIMYHHTDSSVSMHTALADTSGHLGPFTVSYTVPAGSWDFNALRLLSGDFNGDGRDDAVILYHHTDSSISVHTAIANTSGGFGPFTVGYTVPANSWDWNAFRTIAGDFNGDGRSDLAIMYHHTDSSVSMHTALADTSGHLGPFTVSYTVPAGSWDFNALRLL
jgi:hypothetical protein